MRRNLCLIAGACVFLLSKGVWAQAKIREQPSEATLRCATDIPWSQSLDEALALAVKTGRPVFWYVPTVEGSRMDRKPVIDLFMKCGPFASEEVATLLQRKFIPLELIAGGDIGAKYGLRPLEFIEPGFLILAPDGAEKARVDRISTFSNEWFVWQLRKVFEKEPALATPSDKVRSLESEPTIQLAEELIRESDPSAAEKALGARAEGEAPKIRLLRARIEILRRRPDAARELLAPLSVQEDEVGSRARLESARLNLWTGDAKGALPLYQACAKEAGPWQQEAKFFLGVSLSLTGRSKEASEIWKALGAEAKASRWTAKASAEAQRLGPFSRAFERFDWLPEDAFLDPAPGTCRPRTEAEATFVAKRSIGLLLATQGQDGAWRDSNYDFGGTDSLPNVYVAVTALAATALLEWRHLEPAACDKAIESAISVLRDEKQLAHDDADEIAWAHAYRLLFFQKLAKVEGPMQGLAREKATAIAKALAESQLKTGSWRHEYPNPFVTATVLHALAEAEMARIPVSKDAIKKAVTPLERARGKDGTFAYGAGGRSGSDKEFSAGRSPICELALLLAGASDQERLASAIALSAAHHENLERVRKYDDHADRFGNGGFFFWYALHGRAHAVLALKDQATRQAEIKRLRELVLSLPEIDGGFVDSHELGKCYGTAMGLIVLSAALEPKH